MSMKLGFESSFAIVQTALEELYPQKVVGRDEKVAAVVPDKNDREVLIGNIQRLLRTKKNAHLETSLISIHSHTTFEDLTRDITAWSSLPGNPTTPDKPQRDPDGPFEDDAERGEHREREKANEGEI